MFESTNLSREIGRTRQRFGLRAKGRTGDATCSMPRCSLCRDGCLEVPVSVKKHSFYRSLSPAIQQQKLLFTPWFGAFEADDAIIPLLIRRILFSQTPVCTGVGIRRFAGATTRRSGTGHAQAYGHSSYQDPTNQDPSSPNSENATLRN